ncbi:glycosyltransferase family 2 protein [Psychroserpens sp. XS_ASV72]|uniref:glycosyltransferase family 2 protein n=1 Tax=Psychroserpens sp. XS_ASV72 TaxID=3241293 RepID=UPI0035162D02
MKFYIVIPAHNEESTIALTLESLAKQTLIPQHIVVVNDNSADNTKAIVENLANQYNFISLVDNNSSNAHLPGSKIINAFNKGLESLDDDYDVICKFDADLIFPEQYLETLAEHFKSDNQLGMAAGFCYIQKNDQWVLEDLTNKDHIRGALKAYRKQCFFDIGKLKPSIGWDTVDEMLASYYNWKRFTDDSLHVKHLKPTGISYSASAKLAQGEALFKLRYGLTLTFITALKMALKKRNLNVLIHYLKGYFKAKSDGLDYLVTEDQGKFIRDLRWKGIFSKFA